MNWTEHHCWLPEEDLGTRYVDPFTLCAHDVTRQHLIRVDQLLKPPVRVFSSLQTIEFFVQVSAKLQAILTNLKCPLFFAVTLIECCESRCSRRQSHHPISHASVVHFSTTLLVLYPQPTARAVGNVIPLSKNGFRKL